MSLSGVILGGPGFGDGSGVFGFGASGTGFCASGI